MAATDHSHRTPPKVQDTVVPDPVAPERRPSSGAPLVFGAMAAIGLAAIVAGLIAIIAGGDRSALLADADAPTRNGSSWDAQTSPGSGAGGLGLQDGQVLNPAQLRDLAQQSLDVTGTTTLMVDGEPITITRLVGGHCQFSSSSGTRLIVSPSGAEGPVPVDNGEVAINPSPSGDITGVRIDDDGHVIPVERGAETADTMLFGFDDEGVRELALPGSGQRLRLTTDRVAAAEAGRPDFVPAQPGASVEPPQSPGELPTGQEAVAGQEVPTDQAAPADQAAPTGQEAVPDEPAAEDPAPMDVTEPELAVDEALPPEADSNERRWPLYAIAAGVAALVALGLAALVVARRRSQIEDLEPETELDLAEVVARVSDDLNMGSDPRQAILLAYAELESGLAARELVRRSAETPKAFLHRTIGTNPAVAEPLSRLTELFEFARFSDYTITEAMRVEARDAATEIARVYAGEPVLV